MKSSMAPWKAFCGAFPDRRRHFWVLNHNDSLGHPIWGTHKKMNGSDEQELPEFVRLKHHSRGLKSTPWLIFFVSGPGGRRFKSSLPDH
jgi:hypothetical protein